MIVRVAGVTAVEGNGVAFVLPVDIVTADVVVIGGGGAGLRAALEASRCGAQVTMVVKGRLGYSGTTTCQVAETAGFAAADGYLDPGDSPDVHLQDIVEAGSGMCDGRLARILAYESPKQVSFLEKLGVNFVTDSSGRHVVVRGCFGSRPRNRKILGHGAPIVKALERAVRAASVSVLEDTAAVELLVHEGRCTGVICTDSQGKVSVIKAAATVVATGGAGQLFVRNLNPPDITGDGYALGFRAGAQLINMEFMQAGFGITAPFKNMVMTWLWLLNPTIRTADGQDVLEQYLQDGILRKACMVAKSTHYPFSTRDDSKYLEIAVQERYRRSNGGSESQCYLDFSHVKEIDLATKDEGLKAMLMITHEWMAKRGLDILRQPVPIACFAHAINGGLKIDQNAETTLPGLFAAGEVAGGPHGADRLGGTMLAASQVFGARAGRSAASRRTRSRPNPNLAFNEQRQVEEVQATISKFKRKTRGVPPAEVRTALQHTMSLNALICRSRASLAQGLKDVSQLQRVVDSELSLGSDQGVIEAMEVRNLLQVAEIVLGSALRREESRGSHYRSDFPTLKQDQGQVIVVKNSGGVPEYQRSRL